MGDARIHKSVRLTAHSDDNDAEDDHGYTSKRELLATISLSTMMQEEMMYDGAGAGAGSRVVPYYHHHPHPQQMSYEVGQVYQPHMPHPQPSTSASASTSPPPLSQPHPPRPSTSMSTSPHSPPSPRLTPPEELMNAIVEMKMAAQRGSGSRVQYTDTLDLCHRHLQDIPSEFVDVIKDDIVRLALGYNAIYTLPASFVNLHKLRYLNIRTNVVAVFPQVLCEMPCLEILDISRNKIRKLPSEPGNLVNLRVRLRGDG